MKRRPGHALQINVWVALLATLMMSAGLPSTSEVADAAMRGDTEQVRSLLRRGADANAAQGDGMTALHWAAERGNDEVARMLLSAGANVAALTRLGAYTPLHLASRTGRADVVRTLVDAGSDVAALTTTGGVSPLHFAAASGGDDEVSALLEHGDEVDLRETTWGQTPRRFAASAGRAAENARPLLAAGLATKQRVVSLFPAAAERTVLMPDALRLCGTSPSDTAGTAAANALAEVYRAVLKERFG